MSRVAVLKYLRSAVLVLTVGILLILPACHDNEVSSSNKYVNNWILANMEYWYLWNDDIPSSPGKSKNPSDFFNSLLSNEDRFSWIQEDYQELLNSLQGVNKEAGYEYKLYNVRGTQTVYAQVMYIKTGSPIDNEDKDLLRGDKITEINGTALTLANYQSLLGQLNNNHTIKYERFNSETEVWEDKGTLSLTTVEFAENPNFLAQVINMGDDKKIGYYVYNFFATGPIAEDNRYNDEMDAIFAEFKEAGITDLILDLRYNSGGAESATINLASLIATGISSSDVFTRRKYNAGVQQEIINDPRYGNEFLIKRFEEKTQNIESLSEDRIYILTSSRTASASELLINGLKPFMNVFIVGDTTVGKNVGSISIYEDNDPKNPWGMQPIVVKSFNSLNQSDYDIGFIPDEVDEDNRDVIFPLGDPAENLLSIALAEITGEGGRRSRSNELDNDQTVGTSADFKRGGYNLLIDDKRVKQLFNSPVLE